MSRISMTVMIKALLILGVAGSNAHAAGFALVEQSGSGIGNAYAGGAAAAEDASTIFFNPAGMTYVQGRQGVVALHLVRPSADFGNEGSVAGFGRPLGGEGGDAGGLAYVPNAYYMTEIRPDLKFGIGVNVPFGLSTKYDKDWLGRFQAIKSDLKTVNINPAIAIKVNDQLSLGFGVSAMWAQAELTRAVNFVAGESDVRIKGDDWGFGYNFGAIYQITPDTRIGASYRSKVKQHLEGDAKFGTPLTANNTDVKADLTLPENFSLSVFSRLSDKWELMGDVTWTRWSRFKELRINRDDGSLLSLTPENWENTRRYSIGANYRYSDKLKLRAGVAYDEEAIKDEFRTARIPGNDRTWVALGASWQVSPISSLDIGYAHLFVSDASIDDSQLPVNGRLKGEYDASVDILSLQYTHNF
ncbi:Putative outer membrane protein [Methylophilaceae bacterium]|nr:Putative outer membrane protein [Methylophilaceae bacterium]